VNYVLIRRVADTTPTGGLEPFKLNTADGQVDISTQYQLYVLNVDNNGQLPADHFLPFRDATADEAISIGLPDPRVPVKTGTFYNTNYLSSPCVGTAKVPAFDDVTNSPNAQDKTTFTCRYDNTTANSTNPIYNWYRGRPVCQPTERFYVEVAYRHYWVTPFLPEVGVTLSRPKGPNENGFVLIKQRAYLKVEPRFFSVNGGVCPTGIN
jgi:hypothetical protein